MKVRSLCTTAAWLLLLPLCLHAQESAPKSRWVAEAIRRYAHDTWPTDVLALAGQFADFPLRPTPPEPTGDDLPRLSF